MFVTFYLKEKKMSEINNIIKKAIINNQNLSFGKIGGVEASHLANYLTTGNPQLVRGNSLAINAGIIVKNENELRLWSELYLESIKNLDYVLEWCPEQGDKFILDNIWKGKERFYSFEDLEPFVHEKEGWHHSLKNKKILVLSPFKKTIEGQAKKYSELWSEAQIGGVEIIKTPYPPALTNEQPVSFFYTLKYLKEEISKKDFDFAVIGCGGFSLLLAEHIKNIGKPSVHLGGATQLLFGIRGKRWDMGFSNKNWYATDKWTSPLKEEIPPNKHLVEEGCYW